MTTEEKWAARVEAWRQSGMTAAVYSEGKEFKANTLRYWASRLRRYPIIGRKPEVRLARVIRSSSGEQQLDSAIVVELAGVHVAVRRGFDRAALAVVLDVVASREGGR